MSNLLTASIGRKLLMSVSGLFLILFLFVHLILNSFLLVSTDTLKEGQMFNAGVHFMGTNPLIKVIEPMLALGFVIHIIYSLILTFQNMKARGSQGYASGKKTNGVEWASQNMLVLGIAIFAFLVVHIFNFYMNMKGFRTWEAGLPVKFPFFGSEAEGENAYTLVHETFKILPIVIIYIIGSLALAFHLSHSFWSSFQTIGWNNATWMPRLKCISNIVAIIIGGGFSVIALTQYLFF